MPESDVDLLFVTEQECRRYILYVNGTHADVYAAPASRYALELRKDRRNNHNVLLNALCRSYVLYDPKGIAQALQKDARALWMNGPAAPTRQDLNEIEFSSLKMALALRRSMIRASRGPSSTKASMLEFECALLLDKVVACHCRVHRLWMANYGEMLRWSSEDYSDIIGTIRAFAAAPSCLEKCGVVIDAANAVLDSTRKLTRR